MRVILGHFQVIWTAMHQRCHNLSVLIRALSRCQGLQYNTSWFLRQNRPLCCAKKISLYLIENIVLRWQYSYGDICLVSLCISSMHGKRQIFYMYIMTPRCCLCPLTKFYITLILTTFAFLHGADRGTCQCISNVNDGRNILASWQT